MRAGAVIVPAACLPGGGEAGRTGQNCRQHLSLKSLSEPFVAARGGPGASGRASSAPARVCFSPLLTGEAAGSVCILSWVSVPAFMFLIFQKAPNSPGGRETVTCFNPRACRGKALVCVLPGATPCNCSSAAGRDALRARENKQSRVDAGICLLLEQLVPHAAWNIMKSVLFPWQTARPQLVAEPLVTLGSLAHEDVAPRAASCFAGEGAARGSCSLTRAGLCSLSSCDGSKGLAPKRLRGQKRQESANTQLGSRGEKIFGESGFRLVKEPPLMRKTQERSGCRCQQAAWRLGALCSSIQTLAQFGLEGYQNQAQQHKTLNTEMALQLGE